MVEIIASPWEERLYDLAAGAKRSIRVAAPFVKEAAIVGLLDAMAPKCSLTLITSFKLNYYHVGASDLSALEQVQAHGGQVLNHPPLHAKVYIFDDVQAVVTSGNLTFGGLRANTECGVWLKERTAVAQVAGHYQQWAQDERTGILQAINITEARGLLERIPPPIKQSMPTVSDTLERITQPALETGFGAGTQKALMVERLGQLAEEFRLSDLDMFLPEFAARYPANNNLEAKFRQILQDLRNVGLLEFLGNGRYRKLF